MCKAGSTPSSKQDMHSPMKKKVLFLCTGNSCRSQMAEGWTRALRGDEWEAASAGVLTKGVNPNAVHVMDEAGVDIRDHVSQLVTDFAQEEFDLIVTVCPDAHTKLGEVAGSPEIRHVPFDDPPALEEGAEDPLEAYRRVRDEIREFVVGM